MSDYGLTHKRVDGTNVLGFERDGYQLHTQAIQELFVLKGTLKKADSFVRFEIDFDFKLISLKLLNGNGAAMDIYVYPDKNSSVQILSAGINGGGGAKAVFENEYFLKGSVVEIYLTNDSSINVPFFCLIQQINFINYPSS